ncbi:hypothetical protein [Blastococcus tunisiensis]|uniref:hypothetical protein n=1 Tax=Blastococcus tunisiensis TaxID=1798228 RepID=UPI0011137576|nr:hypothetical protein [Blastococcus sp. DSM 46838]
MAAAPEQAPAPSAPAGNPDASWTQAWSTADATNIRSWFEANTGPTRPVSGTVPGGTIRSQADADRLTGRIVTSGLSVACTCTLQDFVLQNSELRITGGQVTVRNAMIDGKGNTSLVGVFTALGSADVTVSRVEITGHNDGIRAYASSVAGEYVYIHGRATANPRNHHQDGIQTIGGATSFDRSYVDMTGANTSATLIKPDASPIPKASVNRSVMIGGAFTFHVHDGPKGAPRNVDLRDNLTAPGYGRGIMSTWELSNPAASMITCSIRLSGTSRMIPLVDGARI